MFTFTISLMSVIILRGEKPTSIAKNSYSTDNSTTTDHIIHHYEGHPSINHIKYNVKPPPLHKNFFLPYRDYQYRSETLKR